MENLLTYTIMPLDTEHLEEICQDIKEQYESGVAVCALFSMTLVPEGNPPRDKAKILCEKYKKFKNRLDEMGLKSGILVQASVGHGWILGEMFPYQTHVNFSDGKATRVCCPCDEGFKDYIYNVMRTIASYEPYTVMVDDDFRLIWYKGEGCACPLHMERFNKAAGTNISRYELWSTVNQRNEKAKKYTDIYIETQKDSLLEAARVMRKGLDSINPRLSASYCCCGNNAEFAAEIADVLKGEGNPSVVRINNGNYTPAGARFFSRAFHRAATQIDKLRGKVDIILAETDTCPQNRYSTSASSLHTHYTGTILEGAGGAKHWITRLITNEPQSGKAYRRILSKHSGFYERLAELYPTLKWQGCRIHTPKKPNFDYTRVKEEWDGWSLCALERLGIPMYFSSSMGGALCLEGEADSSMTDEEIIKSLSGTVILASDTAKRLIDRGFGKYLGVSVREWKGKEPVREIIEQGGAHMKVQMRSMELMPIDDGVRVDSWVYNTVDYEKYERLFAGVTVFKNSFGGTAIVFCGTPVAEFNIVEAFAFLSYSRKEQLIRILKETGNISVYYPGDEEIYMKAASTSDGRILCAVFNIGLDPIEKLELVSLKRVSSITRLMPSGEEKEISFESIGDRYILDACANTLDPVVVFLKN